MAGFNELLHAAHDPGNACNWDTLVVPAHRGHRLGMALKVANLRSLPARTSPTPAGCTPTTPRRTGR